MFVLFQSSRARLRAGSRIHASHRIGASTISQLEQRVLLAPLGPHPRIINGDIISSKGGDADIIRGHDTGEFQSVGIVGNRSGGFCTGTLIDENHVLTAAHCVDDMADQAGRFTVNSSTYATSQVFVHPSYNYNRLGDNQANDIAILRLSSNVTDVTPAEILRQAPEVSQLLVLVGFGAGGNGNSGEDGSFGTKRLGETPIDQVTNRLVKWSFDNNRESNTAPGDSGGPAYIKIDNEYFIAGITSGGTRYNAGIGDESFDTRVDVYANWIDSTLSQGGGGSGGSGSGGGGGGSSQDDYGEEFDGNAARIHIRSNGRGSMSGSIETNGDRDVFRMRIRQRGSIVINLNATDGGLDPYLRLHNWKGKLITANDDYGYSTNSRIARSLKPGVYYVSAGGYDDAETGSYQVSASLITDDFSDSINGATSVGLRASRTTVVSGSIDHESDRDVFRYDAGFSGKVKFALSSNGRSQLDPVLRLLNRKGKLIRQNDDSGGTNNSSIELNVRKGVTYFIDASSFRTSTGDYSLALSYMGRGRSAHPIDLAKLQSPPDVEPQPDQVATNSRVLITPNNSIATRFVRQHWDASDARSDLVDALLLG